MNDVEKRVASARKRLDKAIKEVAKAKTVLTEAHNDRYPIGRFYIQRWLNTRWAQDGDPNQIYKLLWQGENRKAVGIINRLPYKAEERSIGNGLYFETGRAASYRTKTTIYNSIEKMIEGMNRLGIPALMSEQFIMRYTAFQSKEVKD